MSPTLSGLATLFLSALMGLSVDLLSGTHGMHTAACAAMGYARYYILSYTSSSNIMPEIPSIKYYFPKYFTYSGVLILLHHLTLFMLDSFSFDGILHTLIRIFFSAAVNFVIILIVRSIVKE
jgi:rod shape-determining protein MreD